MTNAPQPQSRRQAATFYATSLARRLALGLALVVPGLAAPMVVGVGPAYSQCSPLPLAANASGINVICSGSQTTTVGDGTQDDIVVTVLQGADITVGAGLDAIFLDDNASITNSGTISGGDDGVEAEDIISLTNSGTISGGDHGVEAEDIISLTNSGTISGGDGGVLVGSGSITALVNSGTIQGDDFGVFVDIGITSLTNSGTISGSDHGVLTSALTSLINSGTISGNLAGNQYAIRDSGFAADTSLTLNAGSVLIGRVDLGGGTNTLNIGEGLSLNSTIEELDAIGQTSGLLVATQNLGTSTAQVVAVDLSAFASMDDTLATLTAGIGQTVQGRQTALRSDPALGFSAGDATDTLALNPNRFWIEGFGAYREDDSDRVGSTFESLTGGLVAGVDVPLDALTSLGVMAGFAASTSENETDTQETDTISYYAGVYASTRALGLAWDASFTVGYTEYDQDRITANNLVAGGLETANADFDGWFINPQVTVTNSTPTGLTSTTMGFGLASIEQSLTLSYAGLFLDGYTETGTTNPLTLDDRAVHIATARAALALPFERIEADGALTTLRLIGGIEARTQFGDDSVSGALLGQTVTTTLDDDDATFGGFLGLSGEYQTTSGLTAYASAEALLETDSAYQLSATAGLRIAF